MAVIIKRYQGANLPEALYTLYEDIVANTPAGWQGIPVPTDGVLAVVPFGFLEKEIVARVGSTNVSAFGLTAFVSAFTNAVAAGGTIASKKDFYNTIPSDGQYGYQSYGWTFEVNDNN